MDNSRYPTRIRTRNPRYFNETTFNTEDRNMSASASVVGADEIEQDLRDSVHRLELQARIHTLERQRQQVDREILASLPRQSVVGGARPRDNVSHRQNRYATSAPQKGRISRPKPNLENLRQSAMANKAEAMVGTLWDLESSSSDDAGTPIVNIQGKVKAKPLKSGMNFKAIDGVKTQVAWPHSQLRYEYVSEPFNFQELNLNLFIAGELEIITCGSISQTQKEARLDLLKILVYESNTYPLKAIKDWYASFMHSIEMGRGTWEENPYLTGQAILARHRPEDKKGKSKKYPVGGSNTSSYTSGQSSEKSKVWFCALYNRNRCSKGDSHETSIRGKTVSVEHICAVCWLKTSKKEKHPECSSSCPLIINKD